MSTVLCQGKPDGTRCVRRIGHRGVCTACPSSATLDWDHGREVVQTQHVEAAATLWALDFPTPYWADLHDDL